jgi:hypothetical protein
MRRKMLEFSREFGRFPFYFSLLVAVYLVVTSADIYSGSLADCLNNCVIGWFGEKGAGWLIN